MTATCRYLACGGGDSRRADQEVALEYLMDVLLISASASRLTRRNLRCPSRLQSAIYLGYAESSILLLGNIGRLPYLTLNLSSAWTAPWLLVASMPSRERSRCGSIDLALPHDSSHGYVAIQSVRLRRKWCIISPTIDGRDPSRPGRYMRSANQLPHFH